MTDDSTRPPDPTAGGTPHLERAPGERYRGMTSGAGSPSAGGAGGRSDPAGAAAGDVAGVGSARRAVLAGAAMAVGGAVLFAVLGEIDLGVGLLVVAAFIGWMVGVAIVWGAGATRPIPRQRLVAAVLGAGAILLGLVLATVLARLQGGVLGPIEYTNERYGPLAWVEVVVAGAVAVVRAR